MFPDISHLSSWRREEGNVDTDIQFDDFAFNYLGITFAWVHFGCLWFLWVTPWTCGEQQSGPVTNTRMQDGNASAPSTALIQFNGRNGSLLDIRPDQALLTNQLQIQDELQNWWRFLAQLLKCFALKFHQCFSKKVPFALCTAPLWWYWSSGRLWELQDCAWYKRGDNSHLYEASDRCLPRSPCLAFWGFFLSSCHDFLLFPFNILSFFPFLLMCHSWKCTGTFTDSLFS